MFKPTKEKSTNDQASTWLQKYAWCSLHLQGRYEVKTEDNYRLLIISPKVYPNAAEVACATANEKPWETDVVKKKWWDEWDEMMSN